MTAAQFITLLGILSSIEATLTGLHGWPRAITFVLLGAFNGAAYLIFKFLIPEDK